MSSSDYAFSAIAQGTGIDGGAAINNPGAVAYEQSDSVYVSGKPIYTDLTGTIDPSVQINDGGTVVWRERSGSISRVWESGRIVAGLTTSPLPNFNNSLLGYTSGEIQPNPSINSSGQLAVSATVVSEDIFGRPIATQNVVATTDTGGQINPNPLSFSPPNAATHPQIADDGSIVVRNGNLTTGLISPILIWDNTLTTPKLVAGSSRGFSALGVAPAITSDATAVAFEGNLATPATLSTFQGHLTYADGSSLTLPTQTAGEGVFASIEVQGVSEGTTPVPRVIVRLAGPSDGLSFPDLDGAVGVSLIQGAAEPTYNAVFLATGSDGQLGLYSERFALSVTDGKVDEVTTSAPALVTEVGSPIPGVAGTVSALAIDHPVNDRGNIAFVATLAAGSRAVIVAKPQKALDFSSASTDLQGWRQIAAGGYGLAIADLWGGSDKSTFPAHAANQLPLAAQAGLDIAGYVFLNFTTKTYTAAQQVDNGLAQLDQQTLASLKFVAIDVELTDGNASLSFNKTPEFQTAEAQQAAIAKIDQAVCEVQGYQNSNGIGLTPIIYTDDRSTNPAWDTITGGSERFGSLSLWDERPSPQVTLEPFPPDKQYGGWTSRTGVQYAVDQQDIFPGLTFNADLDTFDLSRLVSPPPMPVAVTDLKALTGTGRAMLTWPAVAGATAYNVFRSNTPGGEGAMPFATTQGTTFTDSTLAPGSTYYYQVAALGVFCNGPMSAEVHTSVAGDLNGDGTLSFSDLLILAQNYGKAGATLGNGDINGDGVVGFDDLLALAQNYGRNLTQHAASPVALGPSSDPLSLLLRRRGRVR